MPTFLPATSGALSMTTVSPTVALLVVAIVVAMLARRLRLPYTVGLVFTGAILAASHVDIGIALTHEFIYDVVLPPLLFEAALFIPWDELRRDAVLTLATIGTIISGAAVTAGMVWLLHWPLPAALVFGVLIAATDPVAVIAMFKDAGVHGRLRLLVESESLLNDGVAAVLFALVLSWVGGSESSATSIATTLIATAGGGVLIGIVCGSLGILVAGRTADRMVETAVTVAAAYGSFLAAEHFHLSGVLATVSAGLIMGNLGVLGDAEDGVLTKDDQAFVVVFWEFAAFIANSLVFILIGVTAARIPFGDLGWAALPAIVLVVLVGRAVTVYPLCLPFAPTRWAIPWGMQHVLWWGGLRGALALALALTVPDTVPMHNQIVIATFAVVGFSVVVQGLTMGPLLKRLGLI
jgi:CPA1 family monovalent cation:H+ antiporter